LYASTDTPTTKTNLHGGHRFCTIPTLLPGTRCFVDAATSPDDGTNCLRSAGIGIFLFSPSQKLSLYIQAQIQQISSVIMAEAAALTLAARISKQLNLQEVSFLSDNEMLVNYLNGGHNRAEPWSIKPFTAEFRLQTQSFSHQVLKIIRDVNVTAHNLASRARFAPVLHLRFSCSNSAHVSMCPCNLLSLSGWEPFSLIRGNCS